MMKDVVLVFLLVYSRVVMMLVKQKTRRAVDIFINEIFSKAPKKVYITNKNQCVSFLMKFGAVTFYI